MPGTVISEFRGKRHGKAKWPPSTSNMVRKLKGQELFEWTICLAWIKKTSRVRERKFAHERTIMEQPKKVSLNEIFM